MIPRVRSLDPLAWVASAKHKVTLHRDAFVAVLMVRVAVTYTSGAAATKAENGVLNAVSKLTLMASGHAKRSWTPARYWYKLPLDLGTKPEFNDVTTAQAAGKVASFELPIFFRLDPHDDGQLSYLLAAKYHSSLELAVEWGAAASIGNDQTITAASLTVTESEIILTEREEAALYGATGKALFQPGSGLLEISEVESEVIITAAFADFKFLVDLPGGAVLTRSFMHVIRNSLRDDTQVTHLRVRDTRGGGNVDMVEETLEQSQARDLREYAVPLPIEGVRYLTGFTVLDYAQMRRGGLDLRGVEEGAVKLGLTTIAPHANGSRLVFIHEQVDRATA